MGARKKILNPQLRGTGWHLMGTAVMGTDASTSVVDATGAAHDVRGLYVFDGSVFPTSSGVNPTATIAANSLRCARLLVANAQQGETP